MQTLDPLANPASDDADAVLWWTVKDLQDAYRTELLNRLYYGHRLATVRRWNYALEVGLAVGTSSAIGAWTIWQGEWNSVWATIAGAAALLAILKPILRLPTQIERYSKLFVEHGVLFYELGTLVRDVTIRRFVTPEIEGAYRRLQQRIRGLSVDDDPIVGKRLRDRCREEVLAEIPVESLWRPAMEGGSRDG